MFAPDQYELIDFGAGRKLERFGSYMLDRPSPAAEPFRLTIKERWKEADWRYTSRASGKGKWTPVAANDGGSASNLRWHIEHDPLQLQLQLSEFGHLGVFPEQAENWDWIVRQVQRANRPLKVLNLFAYTGGSTLAAAAAGAEVVHVDSAANIVKRARENAQQSGLEEESVRWITEDAPKFVASEVKRGNRYDAIILDPPSYGHGPKGEVWKVNNDLMPLLRNCAQLTRSGLSFLLFTCHSPGCGPPEMIASLEDAFFGHCQTGASVKNLCLRTHDGRELPAGHAARFPR